MMHCFLKRLLPFTLTLILGATLANLFGHHKPRTRHDIYVLENGQSFAIIPAPYRGGYKHRRSGGMGPGRANGMSGWAEDYERTYAAHEVTRKAVITFNPQPSYTEEARENGVTGTVKLRVELGSNGRVMGVKTLKSLPDGLTEEATTAAQQIRFEPAQKDGRVVSQYVTVEYEFGEY